MSSCYILDSLVVWPSDKMEVLLVGIFVKETFVIGCTIKKGWLNQFVSGLCTMLDVS